MLVLCGQDGLQRIDQLQHEFLRRSRTFYQREHLESGGFVSANRDGREQRFALLSLSIGIVDVRPEHTDRLDAGRLAALASEAKRQAKQTFGPSVHVLDAGSTSKDAHNPSCAAFSL